MNFAGIPWMKAVLYVVLPSSIFVFPTTAQISQDLKSAEEVSFSMELPFDRPARLSDAAKKTLASDATVADVMRDEHFSVETIPTDWFTASVVHLGPRDHSDLVVMGRGISLGPYSAGFWVLRQTSQGYDIMLATNTHDLALLETSTNGLRDIEIGLTTLSGRLTDRYKFDGQRYQKSEPAQESPSSKIPTGEAKFTSTSGDPHDEKELQFKVVLTGEMVGENKAHLAITNFLASDGVGLTLIHGEFASTPAAQEYFERVLSKALKIAERSEKKDATGKVVGNRAIAAVSAGKPNEPFPAILFTFGRDFYEIESMSSRDSRIMEMRITATN